MPFNCSLAEGVPCNSNTGYTKFRVTAGKTYKLRLVNNGAGGIQYFSIDNHNVTIITNDFVDIIPYKTDRVTLGVRLPPQRISSTNLDNFTNISCLQIGQRSDVLFTPRSSDDAIWMRTLQSGRFCARANQPEGRAIILVNNATDTSIPTTTALPPPVDDGTCKNDDLSLTTPFYPQTLPPPTTTYNLIVNQFINATGHKLFYMNGYSFQGDYNDPILLEANKGNDSYPYDPQWRVIDFGTNSSIRVNVWNNNTSPHVCDSLLLLSTPFLIIPSAP